MPVEDKRLLMELFPKTRLCMHYGLTEASRALFSEFHANAANLESIGRPASSLVDVQICGEDGQRLDNDVDGELCVRGNMVCRSYYLDKDNYYPSPGGEKVSPAAIEEAILSLGVKDCACVAVNDPNGVLGEVPKAYLVKGETPIEINEVKSRLAQLLPPHEIPVVWEWIECIPRTSSGKIQRLKLKQ